MRDLFEVNKLTSVTNETLAELFSILEIDAAGLTDIDKKYLIAIVNKFSGGPVGASTLGTALSEDIQTIEEYIEPYLIRTGFIKKTPRGRVATEKAYKHLGVIRPKSSEQVRLI